MNNLSTTVKMLRKQYNLTQEELSLKSGVGLRFVRDLEQGKETLRLDKVNQLLDFFNYEMVATQKNNNWWDKPKDDEELALTLNGRKKKLQREDFIKSAATLGIEDVIVERLINKYIKLLSKFEAVIQNSFLSVDLKVKYSELLRGRIDRLS